MGRRRDGSADEEDHEAQDVDMDDPSARRDRTTEKKLKKERKEKHRSKEGSEKKAKDRDRDRDRERRDQEKVREKERERERAEREREKERERELREREKEKEREKERQRLRETRDRDKERDRHRARSWERDKEAPPRSSKRDRSPDTAAAADRDGTEKRDKKRRLENEAREKDREARDKERRDAEQAELDDEAEKRRKRIEAWQENRRKKMEEEEAAAAQRAAEADAQKKWTFEDDDSDEEEPRANGAGDGEDVDPLDAFMSQNDAAVAAGGGGGGAAAANGGGGVAGGAALPPGLVKREEGEVAPAPMEEEDEEDPLDAFMAKEILPDVQRALMLEPAVKAEPKGVQIKAEPGGGEVEMAEDGAAEEAVAENNVEVESRPRRKPAKKRKRYYGSEESSSEEEESGEDASDDDEEWAKAVQAGKLSKADRLGMVDHSKVDYPPFRRNFYIEVPELAKMSDADVAELRKQYDGIKVRGQNIPKPVKNWNQVGLSSRILEIVKRSGWERPMPIQAQALPVIMSGRDCIGIAKTGSGKTLAFVLPMLRHIKDQAALAQGDGPIALAMAPTRELVVQISKDVKKFAKALGLVVCSVYGGSGVANQITELKRGAEIVVCTPGRMIDILVTSAGKITNLRRVTYLVLDEADRMFDMGFEPQITRIVNNIRPDRQTVMFSATFPRQVESLARMVLDSPVEIQVGGRSVVNKDITQFVEIRPEGQRFLRLLELLGEWYERGKVLIFVNSQEGCDNLFRDLLRVGYPCLSLHGGKDQSDRESTINDFKTDVCNLLVATSVAARGLDVKELVLVVNYDVPNHIEDYVHRVGRTGRAGRKGTAITFIGPDEEKFAPDLVKALTESGAPVPEDLRALAAEFSGKLKAGTVQAHGSGYGGSGFKFDKAEDEQRKDARKALVKEHGGTVAESEDEGEEDGDDIRPVTAAEKAAQAVALPSTVNLESLAPDVRAQVIQAQALAAKLSAEAVKSTTGLQKGIVPVSLSGPPTMPGVPGMATSVAPSSNAPINPLVAAAQAVASQIAARGIGQSGGPDLASTAKAAVSRAQALAANWVGGMPGGPTGAAAALPDDTIVHYTAELEINDFPQHARWKVTHKDAMAQINELTGAAVTTKGFFVGPGRPAPEGERKLYLLIEGPTESSVRKAKDHIKSILEETTEKVMRRDAPAAPGRYSVV